MDIHDLREPMKLLPASYFPLPASVWALAQDSIRFWDIGKRSGRLTDMDKSIYSAEYQRLCGVLRELRQETGLTQVQVAERLGVPQSFVSKYESGERRLDVVELRHVGEAMGVTLRDILARLGPDW